VSLKDKLFLLFAIHSFNVSFENVQFYQDSINVLLLMMLMMMMMIFIITIIRPSISASPLLQLYFL